LPRLSLAFPVVALLAVNVSTAARSAEIAQWSTTGKDLYEKCASAEGTVSHACGEYLLGVMEGVLAATPASAQVFCPPASVSFFQLETLYINWAKANPDLLGRAPVLAAAGALSAAFPCSK
jgi:hypothetical protein